MSLDELQREVEHLTPDERRKLIGFLVTIEMRKNEGYREELSRRVADKDSTSWVRLNDAERQLAQ